MYIGIPTDISFVLFSPSMESLAGCGWEPFNFTTLPCTGHNTTFRFAMINTSIRDRTNIRMRHGDYENMKLQEVSV